ncbi:MAG: recombinase family protein [Christensenellales bacterium]
MAKIKYIRVSTTHQNTDRQEQNTQDFDKVFIDKISGKNTNRPEFQKMMDYVREGDVVVFESFSRISRSLPDLLNILDTFDKKGVVWYSEKENINTDGATGRLIVAVLGAIGAYEREINAERREYGYKKALEAGTVGRPKAEITPAFEQAYADWKAGKIKAVEAMKLAGMPKATFYKMAKTMEGA